MEVVKVKSDIRDGGTVKAKDGATKRNRNGAR
jgi:hypothetical protein